jgi:hypothetical protein
MDDGMVKIEAVLHPEEAELVWSMLDHAAKHLADSAELGELAAAQALLLRSRTSRRGTTPTGVMVAPVQPVAAGTMADSAESQDTPGRSLLDRLLGEAEAVQGLPLVTTGRPGAATGAAREPSVLHQQVNATHWAFNRADALLLIAQAYQRGDRLQRVPVEVTITIPAVRDEFILARHRPQGVKANVLFFERRPGSDKPWTKKV